MITLFILNRIHCRDTYTVASSEHIVPKQNCNCNATINFEILSTFLDREINIFKLTDNVKSTEGTGKVGVLMTTETDLVVGTLVTKMPQLIRDSGWICTGIAESTRKRQS